MDNISLYDKVELLSNLNHDSFMEICKADKEFIALCSGNLPPTIISLFGDLTENLYKQRSEKNFDKDIISFKPSSMEYREFYFRIYKLLENIENKNSADFEYMIVPNYVRNNNLMEIKIIDKIYRPLLNNFNERSLLIALESGHLEIAKYFVDKGIPLSTHNAEMAIYLNKPHILKYLISEGFLPTDVRYIRLAAAKGYLDMIKDLVSNDVYPDQIAVNEATINNRLNVVEFLASISPPHGPIYPTTDAVDEAKRRNHKFMLLFLAGKGIHPTI